MLLAAIVVGEAASAQPPVVELEALDGRHGFVIRGIEGDDEVGHSVAPAGDVNGDGVGDVIIGAPGAPYGGNQGEAYVVFGRRDGFPPTLDLVDLDGTDGFAIVGAGERDEAGTSVASAGDFDGDGLSDLLVGAPQADPDGRVNAGEAYLIFGASSGFPARLELSTLDGIRGFALRGVDAEDHLGASVAPIGDLNGDGLADVVVGANGADGDTGEAYVVLGRRGPFVAAFDLSMLDGRAGFVLRGVAVGDRLGSSVSSAGDIDADGFDDLLLGAPWADPEGFSAAGASYVVFGGRGPFAAVVELSALDGVNGFVLRGTSDDQSGSAVASAGDVNDDGLDDLFIGAPGALDGGLGAAYVAFGRAGGFPPFVDLSTLDGDDGFVVTSVLDDAEFADSVAGVGDIDGDGVDDLIIGASSAVPSGFDPPGEAYVVYGSERGFPPVVSVGRLDGRNGSRFVGEVQDHAGRSVSAAGDLDDDGLPDLLIGAPGDSGDTGFVYVVYGRSLWLSLAGSCDATVGLTVSGATPQSPVALFRGRGLGTSTVAVGPCGDLDLDLEQAELLGLAEVDAGGRLTRTATPGDASCDTWLQAVDATSCVATNAEPLRRTWLSVSSEDDLLRVVDRATGELVALRPIDLPGAVVTAGVGLATEPGTDDLFALLQLDGVAGSELVRVDPTSGAATAIGNTGDELVSLTFGCDGVLYAIAGDDAVASGTLFTIDPASARADPLLAVSDAGAGEAIGYSPVDGLIYHVTGDDDDGVFESIDPATLERRTVPISGSYGDPRALHFDPAERNFQLVSERGSRYTIAPALAGADFEVDSTNALGHPARGLAPFAARCSAGRER